VLHPEGGRQGWRGGWRRIERERKGCVATNLARSRAAMRSGVYACCQAQTDKQTNRHTDTQTHSHTDKQTNTQTHTVHKFVDARHISMCMCVCVCAREYTATDL